MAVVLYNTPIYLPYLCLLGRAPRAFARPPRLRSTVHVLVCILAGGCELHALPRRGAAIPASHPPSVVARRWLCPRRPPTPEQPAKLRPRHSEQSISPKLPCFRGQIVAKEGTGRRLNLSSDYCFFCASHRLTSPLLPSFCQLGVARLSLCVWREVSNAFQI